MPVDSHSATVSSITGAIPGVSPGSTCTYTQTRVSAVAGTSGGTLDCQWHIRCGGTDVYGGAIGGGYQACSDTTWAPGTYAMDTSTESSDSDPTCVFVGTRITISDDATGAYGVFTLVLDAPTPIPPSPIPPSPVPSTLPSDVTVSS